MANPMTHKYIPRIEQRQENLFIEEYYSSTDVKIYIDDVEQTEISYINYSLQEQLKPIYGYASRTFDDIAIGSRLVNGVFKVPIKNIEAQTPAEVVMSYSESQSTTIDDYNNNQEEQTNSVDWITGENNIENPLYNLSEDKLFEYKIKLMKLGYNVQPTSSEEEFKEALKEFQKDHDEYAIGNFTEFTKSKIDEEILKTDLSVIYIQPDDSVYFEPKSNGPYMNLAESERVYVLETLDDNWKYIVLIDGTKGYVLQED